MQRKPLQDIVTRNPRPRRMPVQTRPHPREPVADMPVKSAPPRRPQGPSPLRPSLIEDSARPRSRPRRGRSWMVLASVLGIAILGISFGLSLVFSGATVTVYPKQQKDVFVDGTFIAKKEPLAGELGYTVMSIERTASKVVEANAQQEVEEYAEGEIIVYNAFDENEQRLIKNTRFETADGKIYRIRDSVTVPGMKTDANGQAVPGTVEVAVYADAPGEEYNGESLEFKIPGFEGTPRYEKFYAKTKTPLKGGFKGTKLTIDEGTEESTRAAMREELIEDLKTAAFESSEKPEGFYLYEDAVFTTFEELPNVNSSDNEVEIQEKGTLTAVLFEEAAFARHIAANTIAGYDENPVMLQNPNDLSLAVEKVEGEDLPWDGATYRIKVTGTADFLWLFDEEKLKKDLAGKSDDAQQDIILSRPGIARAQVSIYPFWRNTFPEDISDIKVVQVLD